MAQVWLLFYTAHRILTPGGIAERHFHWSREQVGFLDRHLVRLGVVVLALVGVVTVAEHQPASLADDVIGIAVVLLGYAAMAWLLSRLLFSSPGDERPSLIKMIVGILFTALPLVLFVAVCFGYYYTSLKLTDRLIDTLYLLLLWFVIEAAFVRGLGVAARRLAYARALAKRQNAAKEGVDGETNVEEPTLGIEQINQQSLRLIRLALLIGFIVCLYWVWADLISVISYLDNVTLYQYTAGTGEAATSVPISLRDFLAALAIAVVTVALARNLPGLLEVLVLQRLTLAQGSAYATTTLLSYAISGIGIVSALSTLGVSWDKLQWLVAALSVGLGFGLQAIFSNFVSGLIILFERPVRIGDVVTIGNLSGTVSRIRIRATTITDFDRKEIIVPNQTFITGQLVNWSLSDTVTRVTIKIGLAYETDLPLARKLMMQAVKENPRVLRDPEPLLYFLTISASTFDYEPALPRPRAGRPQSLYRRDPDEDRHQLPRTQDRHGFQPGRCVRQEPPGPAGPAVRRRAAAQRRRQSARAQGPGRSRRTDPLNLRAWTPSGNSQHNARELPEASLEITRRPRLRQPLRPPGRRLLHRSPARPHRRAAPGGSQPRRPGAARPASGNQRRSAVRRTVRRAQAVVGGRAAGDGVFRPPVRLL